MNTYLTTLKAYWQQRNARERAILLAGAAVLALALLYALLIEPLAAERARLSHSLPALRADAARFARDLASVSGRGKAAGAPDLAGLAQAAGLPADAVQVVNDKQARLQAKGAAWPSVSRLLADAQTQGWRLQSLQVRSPDGGALVDANVEWQR